MISSITNNMKIDISFDGWYFQMLSYVFFGQGIVLFIVRLFEPTLYPVLRHSIYNMFGSEQVTV